MADQLVHEMFAATASEKPQSIAVRCGAQVLTYEELDARANGLAHMLREWGVDSDVPVAIGTERSFDMLVAILAVLKAGGAYVPLDIAWPSKRLEYVLDDCQAPILLTHQALLHKVKSSKNLRILCLDDIDAMPAARSDAPVVLVSPLDLAYVIYTSGSTGQPKGVAMRHGPVCNLLQWQRNSLACEGEDGLSTLQYTSIGFDVSVQEIFSTLVEGGTLQLIDEYERRDSLALLNVIMDTQVQRLFLPFVALDALCHAAMENGLIPSSLRRVMTAGEQLRVSPALTWLFSRLNAVLHNQYGPTETCVICSELQLRRPVSQWPVLPSIGWPIANVSFWVMNAHGQPVPDDLPGELWIGGACLAKGYLGRDALTADSFVPHPLVPGERLYRSGDWVRRGADGAIVFLGRIDHQVKLRGFRVELGEVEATIASHPAVREVAVAVVDAAVDQQMHGHPIEVRRLTAFVALSAVNLGMQSQEVSTLGNLLRSYLQERLPDYMLPDAYVLVDALPRSSSGKLDRIALSVLKPIPTKNVGLEAFNKVCRVAPDCAPQSPAHFLEASLLAVWQSVLRRADLGPTDSFFDAGGHSLDAARLRGKLQAELGLQLTLRDIFEAPTVRALAARLNERGALTQKLLPIPRASGESRLRVSPGQHGIWFIEQLHGPSAVYNVLISIVFQGVLDAMLLEQALSMLVQRHEVLQGRISLVNDIPVQSKANSDTVQVLLPVQDLRENLDPDSRLNACINEIGSHVFDLTLEAPLRMHLLRQSDQKWTLLLNVHHLVFDGWSLGILMKELDFLYNALLLKKSNPLPELPELPIQYVDFAAWDRARLEEPRVQTHLAYWQKQLQGVSPYLDLPTDHPRPVRPTQRGGSVEFTLDVSTTQTVRNFASQEGATLFMVLLGIWAALLSRYSAQKDFVIGSQMANRPHPDVENLIGLFTNTVALRMNLADQPSMRVLVSRVKDTCIDAQVHQDVPFSRVVEALRFEREPSREPLVQVTFVLQNNDLTVIKAPDLIGHAVNIGNATSKQDLLLLATENAGGLSLRLEYALDLFLPETARRMASQFVSILTGALKQPDQPLESLSLLSELERDRLIAMNVEKEPAMTGSIHECFAMMALRQPHAPALHDGEACMTYAELDARANGLAHHLRDWGVDADVPVGLAFDRGIEMVVAMLAVLKAGGAYVPLDPTYPPQRLMNMLEDCGASIVLTVTALQTQLPSRSNLKLLCLDANGRVSPRSDAPVVNVKARDLAYLIYTSGSTGRPKGVAVPHQGVLRLVAQDSAFCISPDDVVLQFASASFDAATLEIWGALLNGACLAVHPPGMPSTTELAEFLVTHKVSFAWLTSALFQLMVDEQPHALAGIRQLLSGGDVLSGRHVCRLLALMPKEHALINGYGPTENTTFTCCYRMQGGAVPADRFENGVPIGYPIAFTDVWVLDENLQPLPVGMAGELYTGGLGLARGYWGQSALTAQRFIAHPWHEGERLYRTGDQVRWRVDGALEFVGRLDQQIKLRGFRIELGEIESALRAHDSVRDAAVVAYKPQQGDARLVAHIVAQTPMVLPDAEKMRNFLQRSLPAYMLPSTYLQVEALPITPNGKLDRDALLRSSAMSASVQASPVTPATLMTGNLLESRLLELWRDALDQPNLKVDDNFFAFGGHSLAAARLVQRAAKELGLKMQVAQFFSTQTVAEMAQHLGCAEQPPAWSTIVPMQPKGTANPLFFFHGVGGDVYAFVPMAQAFAPEQPVYGIQAQGLDGTAEQPLRIEDMAQHYADQLLSVSSGPFRLCGYSLGGWIAWATADELLRRGVQIEVLMMLDVHSSADMPLWVRFGDLFFSFPQRGLRYLRRRSKAVFKLLGNLVSGKYRHTTTVTPGKECLIYLSHRKYRPKRLPVKVEVLYPKDTSKFHFWYWWFMAKKGFSLHKLPLEHHLTFFEAHHAQLLVKKLDELLNSR
ncbi:non-ribosomal peptide synthetase [Limnohabitans sp. Jir72]|uniref:non-ribosomal peptide synthetase n=1 Tax=Limnohabitans sp. Jir72 TaxID=1977909 RepID=UPI000D364777|nr:non-ribosomal peptide synthetase [Limnohabitans sp. Jir72]PUE28100.1 hypothetical protein B9Z52_14600 [Limnohabitans sp. Jir72]